MALLKKVEKGLAKPVIQRLVYLLLLLLFLHILSSNGTFARVGLTTSEGLYASGLVLLPALLLAAQLLWNKAWLWRVLCACMICFTLWLATLSLSQIIAGAGTMARTVAWAFGVIGFTALLVLLLAFANWMLLHMKPKK